METLLIFSILTIVCGLGLEWLALELRARHGRRIAGRGTRSTRPK